MPQLKTPPLEIRFGEAPLPVRPPPKSDAIMEGLARLEVGKQLDINRRENSARVYVSRFQKRYGVDWKFVIRTLKPGWTRIWRTT
jgi:hypothetical protein